MTGSGYFILDEAGNAVEIEGQLADVITRYCDWTRTPAGEAARVVGKDDVGPYLISTVFLGLGHGFGNGRRLFETMVFMPQSQNPWREHDVARYETRQQAIEGHAAMVAKWTAKHAEQEAGERDLIGTPIEPEGPTAP